MTHNRESIQAKFGPFEKCNKTEKILDLSREKKGTTH